MANNMAMGLKKDFIKKACGVRKTVCKNINSKETTEMASRMVMAKKPGLMVHSILVTMLMEKKTDRA